MIEAGRGVINAKRLEHGDDCTRGQGNGQYRIEWEDGSREAIRIEQVASPDFITFKTGQPFEAIVSRDPVDFRLLRIVHIERRPEPSRLPEREETELLESIGSATILPAAWWE